MPTTNPRITITLEPQLHALLRELSRLTGNSQAAMVTDLLKEAVPVFERMASVLQAAEKLKEQGLQSREEVVRGLERAQGRMEAQLGLLMDDLDEGVRPLLDQAEKVTRRRGRASAGGAATPADRPRRAASPPMSNRGVRSPQGRAGKAKKGAF